MKGLNGNLTVCVLISCMNQDKDIVERTNVQTNVVVVNQCDVDKTEEWDYNNPTGEKCHVRFISTKERGLSRSRNMAIRNALGDVCIISDDDEELVDGYEDIIKNAYKAQPNADIISFAFERSDKTFPNNPFRHSLKTLFRTSSVELSFRRESIVERNIFFDEKMGSGTGNGAGEENMFLITCKRNKLQMFYHPAVLGKLLSTESKWFDGFTERYFENFGWATRRILGAAASIAYLGYWILAHHGLYIKEISTFQVVKSYMAGWASKR